MKEYYCQTCLKRLSNGTFRYGHIRQVVTKYRFNKYEMYREGKLKLRSHYTSYTILLNRGGH